MKSSLWALAVFLALLLTTHYFVRLLLSVLPTNTEHPQGVQPKKATHDHG